MKQVRSIIYSLTTPFNPIWAFKNFATEHEKAVISISSFVFGLLIILIGNIILLNKGVQYELFDKLLIILIFFVGVILKNLFICYLLFLLLNRIKISKIKWIETFAIVSFALIPLSLGTIWTLLDARTASIGQFIGIIWNAVIIIIGLKVINKISFWKGALFVMGILAALKFVEITLIGIKI